MELANFQQYIPSEPKFGDFVLYLRSSEGEDWYESQITFTKQYKIAFEPESGIVRGIARDVSGLFPLNLSVADVEVLPEGCSNDGTWIYSAGEFSRKNITPESDEVPAK